LIAMEEDLRIESSRDSTSILESAQAITSKDSGPLLLLLVKNL
jgi:hypothetical protein